MQKVSLYIKAASELFWHRGLVQELRDKKVLEDLIFRVKSFIQKRKCRVVMGEAEEQCSTECGLPQGSPLSPTLVFMFIEDFLRRVSRREVMKVQGFVNDIFL